ncbi:Gfo/Idh/MocA family protein [Steroidobacter agaridevorans]|uniref:Gfo/Idh/MocA family protein n=1 Tax=Steroidobacter agaridevorans TaxID=2695856 RepID=UPI001324AB69|nr:Gfo/Idh/MocA family oxidoreductase [Steroidobacter agaridevorans]GFE91359.1 oxidoreductase [Steroidobacter agaridevorans]
MSARLQVPTQSAIPASRLAHARPRLGFVGLGWIGRKRLDALTADSSAIEVAALVDSDADRLRAAAAVHPDASVSPDVDELLDEDLDAVVIATPNGLHANQAIACLERGLAVFCQKPLATTLSDVQRVLAAARAADRLLGIDFCYRYITGMRELRRRLMSGEIGEVIAISAVFHNAYGPDKSWCKSPALAGGGCLLDLGVHLLDLALWVQGMPPTERVRSRLFAHGQPVQGRAGELEDLAYAEFIQANGAIVRLCCSWYAHIGQPAQIRMEIAGTRGGASWRNVDGSFYDFDVHLFHGTEREQLGTSRDDWGTRALRAWLRQLHVSKRFDAEAENIVRSAALIEEVYRA